MASTNGYPKVTTKAWRTLRGRAASAPSTKFTPAGVAALMGMSSPKSAGDNTVYPMRRLGLIDDEGALTARGNKWRTDGSFAEACQEILDEVYPAELLSLTREDGQPDAQQVRTWFDHKGFGESNARQMAATYVMIASKEVPEVATAAPKPAAQSKRSDRRSRASSSPSTAKPASGENAITPPAETPSPDRTGPQVHLDIQIHIPAEATAEQIDHIFGSMAKHLYKQ